MGIIAYTSRQISLATARNKPLARRSPTRSNTANSQFLPKSGFSLSQLNLNDSTYCLRMPCSRSSSRCSIRFDKVSEIEPCFTQEILALHHQLLDPGTPVFKNIPGIAIRKRWRWKSINGALRIDVELQKMRRRVVHLRHTDFSLGQISATFSHRCGSLFASSSRRAITVSARVARNAGTELAMKATVSSSAEKR
jgi:hypothetical protein